MQILVCNYVSISTFEQILGVRLRCSPLGDISELTSHSHIVTSVTALDEEDMVMGNVQVHSCQSSRRCVVLFR